MGNFSHDGRASAQTEGSAPVIHTVLLSQVPMQPWRNGGGVTQELLAWPASEGAAASWQLRISLARIDRSGPFSAYPGVERWFAVVQGEGVVLRFASRRVMLGAGSEPVRFDGAAAPGCELLDGATQDLNLMVRSDAGRGAIVLVRGDEEWASTARLRALYSADDTTLQINDTDAAVLQAGTLAWAEDAGQQRWRLKHGAAAARAWWLQFKPRTP